MTPDLSAEQLATELVNRTQYGYALEYCVIEGKQFSFDKHNYLIDIYMDKHPYQVIEKAAQMGASVLGMIKSFYVCDKLGKTVIYFFPTDEDVREFSKARVKPVINDSEHIREIVDDVDSVSLRQVGRGFLYFRGMKSNIRMKSIPADMLVFDELDEVGEKERALADQRLNHSDLRWRFMLSTPTFDNYGIDYEFRRTDQRYWNLICKKCDTRNILEFQFPDCVKRVNEDEAFLQCRKCSSPLDTQYGMWIAEKPAVKKYRGYHMCGLYSYYMDLPKLLDDFASGRDREELFRSKLGLPWVSADQKITRDMVESCMKGESNETPSLQHTYMGVDQKGDELHIIIRGWSRIMRRPQVLFVGKVRKFHELSPLMATYDVDLCVIDGLPNQHSARDFSEKHAGRVFLCYYNDNQKGNAIWKVPDGGKGDYMVTVNRTEALDAMYEEIQIKDLILPSQYADETRRELTDNLCNLARITEEDEDTGQRTSYWKKLGSEHYAHANSYSVLAQSRFSGPAAAVTVQSKAMSHVNYSRSYHERSIY